MRVRDHDYDHPDDYWDPADDDVPPRAVDAWAFGRLDGKRDPLLDHERPGSDTHTDNLRGGY